MTSSNKWEAQVDDARVDTTSDRLRSSIDGESRAVTGSHSPHRYSLFGPTHDPYSEAVADWNIGHHRPQIAAGGYRASLDSPQGRTSTREESRRHSLSHKPDVSDLRQSSTGRDPADMGFFKRNHDKERKLKSSHGEKPLPSMPNGDTSHTRNISEGSSHNRNVSEPHNRNVSEHSSKPQVGNVNYNSDNTVPEKVDVDARQPHDSGVHSELGRERGYLVRDSEHPVDLTGVVDLTNTEDTDVSMTYAPEVIHETRHVQSHEIVQEVITREIHNHHIYHRVLPILDFEVLPPRHFIPAEGGELIEIPESQIPGGANGRDIQQALATALSNLMPRRGAPLTPRQFTARTFSGTEGDYKEYIGSDGIPRTEQWWVHPPTLERDSAWTGRTVPFHLHSESSEMDGFRDVVLDRSSDLRSLRETIPASSKDSKSGTKRFPPPRGASLGKTSMSVVDGSGAGGAGAPTVLPIRMAHGEEGQAGSASSTKPPGVGVAY